MTSDQQRVYLKTCRFLWNLTQASTLWSQRFTHTPVKMQNTIWNDNLTHLKKYSFIMHENLINAFGQLFTCDICFEMQKQI